MADRRSRILRATSEAARIRDMFPYGKRTGFDIIHATAALGFPVLFRPIRNLLGGTVVVDDDARGILITTNRGLGTQRFTLAHELGHIVMDHRTQFDGPESDSASLGGNPIPIEEQAAESFASELLAPKSRIVQLANRYGWKAPRLREPSIVYQLALRMGVSFRAMCWSLFGANILPLAAARGLAENTNLQEVKRAANAGLQLPDPKTDVWMLTPSDSGSIIEAGPFDVFVTELIDRSSSGFLWDLDGAKTGFEISQERGSIGEEYGGDVSRRLILRAKETGSLNLELADRRPWNNEAAARVEILVQNYGPEESGLARQVKRALLEGGGAS
ncbi:MAG: ImmA/IrrE family metallo-endopeptidase [Thermoplasmata archaeon]|nr:ImmA/IrrE family metallo-endopeptidase [Thermoplasmata archaeon]